MSEPIIVTRNLCKTYPEGDVQALIDVSLTIHRGESVAIVGPSGSGKTTFLNVLGLLDHPSSGEFEINGRRITPDVNLDRVRSRELGFVFQLHNLIPRLTAVENVMIPMLPTRRPKTEQQERATALLERVGLRERLHFQVTRLSGGERQRVAIARAIANEPTVILADEPTGNLDSRTGREVIDLLLELNQTEQSTLLVVTHDTSVANRMSRTLEIRDGRVD
jgi:putative ABC transport system ATP-binding protein